MPEQASESVSREALLTAEERHLARQVGQMLTGGSVTFDQLPLESQVLYNLAVDEWEKGI